MITREKLQELIDNAGLAHYSNDLLNAVKPAIHIKSIRISDESRIEIGVSKLGGSPALPLGFEWPHWKGRPLTFIAQVRLSDIAVHDIERALPPVGRLYFFYEANGEPWGFDPADRGSCKVFFLEDESVPLEHVPHPTAPGEFGQIEPLHPCIIEFSQTVTLPTVDVVEKLGLLEPDLDRYWDVLSAVEKATQPIHHLLGYPDPMQGDMEVQCQLVTNGLYLGGPTGYSDPRRSALEAGASDWRLLLQIDTDESGLGVMWGDMGRIYYWIQRQALQVSNFDNTWLIFQCA